MVKKNFFLLSKPRYREPHRTDEFRRIARAVSSSYESFEPKTGKLMSSNKFGFIPMFDALQQDEAEAMNQEQDNTHRATDSKDVLIANLKQQAMSA